MNRIIVSMNITLDGFLSGPNCELDWHFDRWNKGMGERLMRNLYDADTVLLGKNTYRAMARYWSGKELDPFCPQEEVAFAAMLNSCAKIVFSNTLEKPEWRNSRIVGGNLGTTVRKLKRVKQECNKGIMIYGSSMLVTELVRLGLIDEYQLWIHPVLLGAGKPMFRMVKDQESLLLRSTQTFSSGVVLLQYEVLP